MPKKGKKNKNGDGKGGHATFTGVKTLGGFSDRTRVTLRYVEEFSLTTATVAATGYVFAGNDVYDPNVTGTGGQPANYDDYSGLYTRYRVLSSKLTLYPAPEVDANDDGIRVNIGPLHVSTLPTTHATQNDDICQPFQQFQVLTYYNTKRKDGEIRMPAISTMKVFGNTWTEFAGNPDNTALVTASPAHRWFWVISQSNVNTANTNTCFYTAFIDYDIEFWDRVDTTLDLDQKIRHLQEIKEAKTHIPSSVGDIEIIPPGGRDTNSTDEDSVNNDKRREAIIAYQKSFARLNELTDGMDGKMLSPLLVGSSDRKKRTS